MVRPRGHTGATRYCGWGFNGHYWKLALDLDLHRRYTPQEAHDEISDDSLKSEPFFALDDRNFFPNPLNLLGPGLDELASDIGSEFVDVEVKYSGLDSYYTSNNAAHDKVKVKDWLLAEAFPATTLPMGANYSSEFTALRNVDMSGVRSNGGCCKTSVDSWPRKEDGNLVWFHSDYKDIAYQHVFTFYEKIKELSKN